MGVVLAVPAIIGAIEGVAQKEADTKQAKEMIARFMAQEQEDERRGQQQVDQEKIAMSKEASETMGRWLQVYHNADDHYRRLVRLWQEDGLSESASINVVLGNAASEFSYLAAYLRSHTIEDIRRAKLSQGSGPVTFDNDKFLQRLAFARNDLGVAKRFARTIKEKTQALLTTLADIDSGSFVALYTDLVNWTRDMSTQISGLQDSLSTYNSSLQTFYQSRSNILEDIKSHFRITMGDVAGGIAHVFVGQIEDGWQSYVDSSARQLSEVNQNIYQTRFYQASAQIKIDVFTPLLREVANLQGQVATDRTTIASVHAAMSDIETKINNHYLTVSDAAGLFSQINDPEKDYTSTAKLVSKISQAAADMLDVDFRALAPSVRELMAQLGQVTIPAPNSTGVARESTSSSGISDTDARAEIQTTLNKLERPQSTFLARSFGLPNFPLTPPQEDSVLQEMGDVRDRQTQVLVEIGRPGSSEAYTP